MRKRFKRRKNYFKYILLILMIFLIYLLFSSFLLKIKLTSSNEEFLRELLKDSNHHLAYENNNSLSSYFLKMLYQIDIKNPVTILNGFFGFSDSNNLYVVSADSEEAPTVSNYITLTSSEKIEKPLVYIYNTHQTENYSYKSYEEYNITPNVMMASYVLKERLGDLKIEAMVEDSNIKEILNSNSWSYSYSYNASRFLIKDTLEKYPSIRLFIDLHRDSVSHKVSTTTINGKKYAKVMFVIGKEYDSYKNNLAVANKLNNIIKDKASISRGILLKEGANVNGIYNQDLNSNIILIECGGSENTLDEVLNTIDILANSIAVYLGDQNG